MSYIDDEELKIDVEEDEDAEDKNIDGEELNEPIDDDLLADDNPLDDEFAGLTFTDN